MTGHSKRAFGLVLVLMLATTCAHAKATDQGATNARADDSAAKASGGNDTKAQVGGPGGNVQAPSKPSPNAPPIAAAPQGILKPGTVHEIQQALRSKGFEVPRSNTLDERTRAQIAAFQRKQNLADTGLPDHETLRRLGLNPDDVLRNVND